MTEEAVEFLHDRSLHDLPEEGVLLGQLLGTEVLPTARGPLVVVEEVDEGRVGRLGEQLLVDICEEPGRGGGRPEGGLVVEQNPPPAPAPQGWPDRPGQACEGGGQERGGSSFPPLQLLGGQSSSQPSQSQKPSQLDTHSPSRWLSFCLWRPIPSLPSTPPALRRKERRAGKEAKPGVGGHRAGRVKGPHGSGQRSTWSPVSEGEMRFWLLRMMSSFWALWTSAL